MRKIVKYLQDNGADAAKVAAIKGNYDKLNEKLGLVDENGVLSEEDFNKALANLKQARDFTEGFLNNQPSLQLEAVLPANRRERAADDRVRDSRFPNAYTTPYATAKEFYYEDGQKGSSPYDKYTYLFHTFTESLVANNRTHSPVRDVKRLVYEEVNEVEGGYLWTITFNAAHEDQHDGYAFFSIPKGQVVDNSSITIERTPQAGVTEEVAGTGDLDSRVRNSLFHGTQIGIRRDGANENSLEGLARTNGSPGYYNRRLEGDAGETAKSDDMFEKIADNTAAVYRFQLHGRDKYTISFKTTNTNNTQMDKLYYAAGYRVQQWGRRILAQQWHGRHKYDRSDTDNYPLHVVGNGTFLINQGKHYNTAYPQGAYGFGGHDFDYAPFKADGILGFDDSGRYNSNFDMHQYTARPGSNQPSSSYRANAAGQTFEFYDKEGNKLSASQIGMHGADKPGLVEYKVKRKFNDGSADFLNIKFAIKPKTPVFTENLTNSRGQTKNLTVSNGTNGYPITLFREYVENGVKQIEKVATVNANSGGNAVFNNVLIKGGKYYAQSIIPTSAYLDYKNVKHTDVRSDVSASTTVGGDGMAPTIQVGENGKALATTPANNQVTLFVTPSTDGKVSLKVQMQDDNLGDGMDAFAKGTNANYAINGTYNSGATTYTADGGVTGANGKRDTIKGDLKIQLNQDGGKYKIPTGGLTVTLNAKDKAGNWTNNASPSKTLTVKVLSAVPNEPPVRMLTGNDVQNGAVKQSVKDEVLSKVKQLNPDLVNNGVTFEYDTTAGRTNQIKVTYPDGQTTTIDPMKGTKPTKPLVVGPQDGTVSITPQGDADKVTFSYVPTGQTSPQQIIAKKDGNSWGIQGTRPNGITVDSSTGKITITEPTVKDLSTVTATATFLNSDTSDTAQDTAKNPDREAPEVWMNGKKLTETATDNKFLIYRGATFNPTFRVADNSGIIANLSVKNIPNGVWFNKVNNKDVPRTLIHNGNYTFSDTVVDQTTLFGTREATVSVRDANGNAKDYKFQYIIADVLLKNSPESNTGGAKLGDPHRFLATTLNGTTSSDDRYFPGGMTFSWGNNENSETKLPATSQTVTKEVIATFPANSRNGGTTADGITVYAPERITKNATINVVDNSKPQATLNGQSLGETATTPIFTVFRGANFNPTIKAWDNSGIIQDISVQNGLPTGVTATRYTGGRQTGKDGTSDGAKYSQALFSGVVANTQALGEYEISLSVKGSDNNDVSTFRFKYRVVDMELKNTVNMPGVPVPVVTLDNNKSVLVANGQNNLDAHNYWKVVDEETKADKGDSYLPQGINFTFDHLGANPNGISSNPNDENLNPRPSTRQGLYRGKVKVSFANASGEVTNNNSTTRTVFAPAEIAKDIRFGIVPNAPSLEVGSLYGKATTRPTITVSNVVLKGDAPGKVNTGATRYVALYSTSNPNSPLAEKEVTGNNSTVTFSETDTGSGRLTRALTAGEQIYAVTRVEHAGSSILSGASNEELVTAPLNLLENSTNRIIQANDQILNDAEKTGIRIALRAANPGLNLSDENIEITDSGAITVTTADKRRGWLQTAPNKDNGAGFVTRFANIRNDYKFENIEGLKVPGRDTDKGFAWSNAPSDNRVNSNRSLIYYYDATKGQSFNFNDVLNILSLREGWSVNHTENPSFVATQGGNKAKAEANNRRGEDGFSMGPGNTFLKDGNYINVMDIVESSERGGSVVKKSNTKQVEDGKTGGTATTLQNVTIGEANGLPEFALNNVVGGRDSIHKAQVYLRPKWVTDGSLRERNNETKDTTTNVVNLYFVPIDPIKPVVERSDSNNLGTSADDAPRLTDTSITASSLVKVTDNYDKDDETDSNTNSVRNKLNVWIKKGNEEIKVVENGRELTTATGETVLSTHIKTTDPATYELIAKTADTSGNETEKQSLGFFKVGYNLNVRPLINFIRYEKLTDDDKRTLVRVNEGGQLEELPNGATVDVTFDTENVNKKIADNNGGKEDKRATATITFANGATTTRVIPYSVYQSFPVTDKLYDFAGATKYNYYWDPDYYTNVGLTGGMEWFVKREVEENGRKVFKDVPPQANSNDHRMPREVNKSIEAGVGEYKYILGATYPTGRYTATTTDELLKLRRSGEIVHTVFDVGANNTNKVTVNSGDSLTSDQAKEAVMPINGSKELPEGTTYEWVSGLTVTGRGGDEVDREVRVTLPATNPNGPFAAQKTKSKTIKVKVKIEDVKPTVKIKIGDSVANLTTTAQDNRFVIFKGATFNPTFIVDDNSGKTTSINITNLPNGRSINKTEAMPNGTNVTVTDADAVTRDATTGTREASVTVADAVGNTETYKFKYTVVDVNLVNSPKEVPLNKELGDSHAFAAVDKADLTVSNPDSLYPDGMIFEWKKNNQVVPNRTQLSEPGRVTDYKAVVRFKDGAGFYTVNGIKTFTPATIEKDVTFLVKPTKPIVTPDNNGDVTVTPANETNVNKVEVTYTPTDNNRLEDNGNVTKTPQERTTVIATKGTDNQWRITSGEKEGISVNPTTGEITLKDQVVKDQTKIQAKVVAQEVSSDENDSNNSKDGERTDPTIGLNNTLVEVGKEFSLPLVLSDGAGVGVDDTNIKVSLPNGETGLTYDATTKSIRGTISAAVKKDITVRVLDKNGNKAEKIISIAAVKSKPVYAIKDGTIDNVDTPSNFVEMPAGLTAYWKDNSKPTTTEVGNTKKTVTVSAEGYNAINVDIPVTIYPKVTYRKVGGNEVTEYHEIVGRPLTSSVWGTGGRTKPAVADFYVEFEGGTKPDGTTIRFKDGDPVSLSTTAGITTKTIVVTYPNGAGTIEKDVTFKTYGNEAKYEDGKDSVETIVGSAFEKTSASDYVKLSDPKLPNPPRTAIAWGNGYTPYNPVNKPQDKIGKREENVNVYFGEAVRKARGDDTYNYNDQNIKVTLDVKPQAPTLTANQFQGKAGTKPEITVNNLPTAAQLTTGLTVKVQLKDAAGTVVAEKTVTDGTGSTTFTEADYRNSVTLGQQLTANVVVSGKYQKTEKTDTGTRQVLTDYSLVSNNSNSEQVTPQKPTFDTATVTSTSRTLRGTLGGFDATNRVVKVYLNDENNTVLSSENNGGVTINNDGTWTATLPAAVKLRQSVAKNGETTTPPAITVENTVTDGTVSTRSDNKAVEMGDYSVASTIAGSKHLDITVPHDAKRVELRFHNSTETGNTTNSIVLVRGTDGTWHTDATRADNTSVTDANGYVGTITSTPSTTNPSENNIRIAINEQSGTAKLHIKEENSNGDNTESYGSGLGLRVYTQPEVGQAPTATGKWKVASVTNNNPTLTYKGTEGSNETARKVFSSGTSITKAMLEDLVTVGDTEDKVTNEADKPYGTPTVKIVSGLTETPGNATPAGRYTVVLKAVDSQGKESDPLTVYVGVVSTAVKYQPQFNGRDLGTAQDIPVSGGDHAQGEVVNYTPGEVTVDNKVYVPVTTEGHNVTLTDQPQTVIVEYVEKPATATPTFTVGTQDPQTGNVEVTIDGVPEGTKVKLPGIASEKVVTGGKVELTNNELPENPTTGKGIAQEEGKLPKEGTSDITIPGKLTSAKGEPAREFEVEIPLPIVVPDPEHLTPKEKTELEKKVKKSNPNMDVKVDDKGNVTITDPKTGQSKVIPVKDLTVKDFTPVKPTDKLPVKDKAHLTPEEKKQVADKVKDKNPGKEVTVGDDGTATVTDPTTGISHTIPGTDLVNQDFEPVKPDEKVPVKDKAHLTPEEKKQVADKVKDKNPGKEVTVGDDGTATVTDPTTGISHTIPGTDLVNQDFEPVKPDEKVPVKDKAHLTPEEKKQVADKVKDKNPGKEVTVGDDGTATVTDPTTGISHTIPGTDLVNQDFEPVIPADKIPVKDPANLTQEEQDKVKESVEKANPGKKVTVDKTGKVTITDPNTNISHEIPGEKLITLDPPVFELPEYTAPIGTTGVDENGNLIEPPVKHQTKLIITKWVDEEGHDLKPADAKAPNVLGEANEAFEHGEIEGYVFVRTETKGDVVTHIFRKVSPARPTGDGQQRPATPSADTNRRPDTATPAEVPATQPTEQPSQTVEVPAQLQNEVSETDSSVSQPQTVLPNTGTQEDRATGALGVLSLLGTFGLLAAKKKKDDKEEA